MASSYKSTNRAFDSLENSLKQIHDTNRLLNNIDNKLCSYFGSDEQQPKIMTSPKESSSAREHRNPLMDRSRSTGRKEEFLQLSGLALGSPLALGEKDLSNYLSPSEESRHNRGNNLSTSQVHQFKENTRPVNIAPIENLPNKELTIPLNSDVMRVGDILRSSEGRKRLTTEEDSVVITGPVQGQGKISGLSLIEKMNKVEESYQSKIQILEERLHSSEYENETLRKQMGKIEQEMLRMRRENDEAQVRLAREQRRTQETEEAEAGRLEELRRELRDVREERELLKDKYNELLRMHNQMIELDIQKNEKSLREHNESVRRLDEMDELAESINGYQQEVEILKESNFLAQKQWRFELQKLQDDLRHQKEENERLNRVLQEERLKPQKPRTYVDTAERKRDRSERSERSGVKDKRQREYGDKDKDRDDNLASLSKSELAKYAKGLQESFAFLEVKHQEQVKHNEVLQSELRTLGESSKEEIGRFNEAFSEVYYNEGERKTNGSIIPRHSSENVEREGRSRSRSVERRPRNETSQGRRERLREELRKDLAGIPDLGRMRNSPTKSATARSRSRSRSVKFSPRAEIKVETSPTIKLREIKEINLLSTKSQTEFENELKSLKEMVNQSVPLKKAKERHSKKPSVVESVSGRGKNEKSFIRVNDVLNSKPKAKTTQDKDKKRKKI